MVNAKSRLILSGMPILIGQNWSANQAIIIEDKLIKAIIPQEMIEHHLPAEHLQFPADHYLSPGFVDLHIHGLAGKDVMDAEVSSLKDIALNLASQGVTGFLATTMSAPAAQIEKILQAVVKVKSNENGAQLLGVHLEGPFIAESKKGAHSLTQKPDINLFNQWQRIAQNAIKLVTIAPELPGALDFIKALIKNKVIVSIGHTNATYHETHAAIEIGASQATHLFNAMHGIHQREPGAAGALLLSEKIKAELIVDGKHLHPAMLQLALHCKGKENLLLVTDAMRASCMGDGDYDLGGQIVHVRNGEARLANHTLAGSTLRMNVAIKNMMAYTGCSLIDAITMASFNPLEALSLDEQKGSIMVGKDADLVLLSKELEVKMTLCRGKMVFKA